MTPEGRARWAVAILAAGVILLAAVLRLVYIDADPPHGLSVSRAAYTDEGLKYYEARNRVLFGSWLPDVELTAAGHLKTSPVPTFLGWAVFETLGVGRIQARLISVSAGVLSCALLILVGVRTGMWRTGLVAGLFASVSFLLVSFDRIGLFDAQAACLLMIAAFFYHMKGWKRYAGTVVFLVLAYFTRASTVAVSGAFMLAFCSEVWQRSHASAARKWVVLLFVLALAAGAAALSWRVAGGTQVARQLVTRLQMPYFQTFPLVSAAGDLAIRTLSDSMLAVRMPLLVILALLAFSGSAVRKEAFAPGNPNVLFVWWFAASLAEVAFLEYRPTRYYLFMLPAACWLSAQWIVSIVKSAGAGRTLRQSWLPTVLRVLAGAQIAAVALRFMVENRRNTPLAGTDATAARWFEQFVETHFIGSRAERVATTAGQIASQTAAMWQHIIFLVVLGIIIAAVGIAWARLLRRLRPGGIGERTRLVTAVVLTVVIVAGQAALVQGSLSKSDRRYEMTIARRIISRHLGDDRDICIAGNWAPSLCLDTRYFAMPFARGNGNAWNTFVRFPVTHLLLEMGNPDEDAYFRERYPRQYARSRLLAVVAVDFYRIGLFEYDVSPDEKRPQWPFDRKESE